MKKLFLFLAVTMLFVISACKLSNTGSQRAFDASITDAKLTDPGSSEPKAAWSTVANSIGDAGAGSISMKMYNGTPYVAFSDNNNSGKITVKSCASGTCTSWGLVGNAGFSANEAYDVSLYVHDASNIYVAFRELVSISPLKFKPRVMKYDGSSSWAEVGNITALLGVNVSFDWYPQIFVYNDLSNNPVPFLSAKGRVLVFDGTNWTYVGPTVPGLGVYGKLAVYDDAGVPVPYLAFVDSLASDNVSVVEYNAGTNSWDYVGSQGFTDTGDPMDSTGNVAFYLSSTGTPYVFFANRYNALANKGTCLKFNGTAWVNVGNADFTAANVSHTAITVDESTGTVYVGYNDHSVSSRLTVKANTNGNSATWTTLGSVGGVSSNWANFTNLAIGTSGAPFIVYEDSVLNASYVKKYQ